MQQSFVDALVSPKLGSNRRLEELHGLVDWKAVEAALSDLRSGATGRPPYPPLKMLKALYLQTLYDLSDEGLEEALVDRLSFRQFCGFALTEETPDKSTICRFRQAASDGGVLEACFRLITAGLEARGLVTRKGTLVDATIVAARHKRPPMEAGRGAKNPAEPEADWTFKGGKSYFGYKLHVGMDEGGLVRRAVFTPAKVYESEVADALVSGDERALYGDRAYENKVRRQRLKEQGIKDRTMRRANKWHPVLSARMQRRNQLISRRRAPVEAVFSALKRLYGMGRARYATLARNAARAFTALALLNLCRARRMSAP